MCLVVNAGHELSGEGLENTLFEAKNTSSMIMAISVCDPLLITFCF